MHGKGLLPGMQGRGGGIYQPFLTEAAQLGRMSVSHEDCWDWNLIIMSGATGTAGGCQQLEREVRHVFKGVCDS